MRVNLNCLIFLLSVGFFAAVRPAFAQEAKAAVAPEEQSNADALIQQAVEHYGAQRYQEAADSFRQAYEILKEPELLFNVARCYEKMANAKEALDWYERFLAAPNTTTELRTRALNSIAQLHREIAAEKAVEKAEETTPQDAAAQTEPDAEQETEPAAAGPETQEMETTPPTDAQAKHGPAGLRIASYSLIGVGLAGMITGGVFGGLSLAAKSDFESTTDEPVRVEYRNDMTRDALIFDIVFFSGVAVVTTGLSLFIADLVKRNSETAVTTGSRMGTDRKSAGGRLRFTPVFSFNNGELTGGLAGHF